MNKEQRNTLIALLRRISDEFGSQAYVKGYAEGYADAYVLAQVEGIAITLTKLMTLKFGALSPDHAARIMTATEPELDLWIERILTASTPEALFVSPEVDPPGAPSSRASRFS